MTSTAENIQSDLRLLELTEVEESWYGFPQIFNQWWIYPLIINAILGLVSFEYVWYKSRRHRKPIKELDELMPAFRRIDAHRWSKWRFYIGSFFLWPRGFIALTYMLVHCLNSKILFLGHDLNTPVTGFRKWLVYLESRWVAWSWMVVPCAVVIDWEYVKPEDVNYYEEFLGTREEQAAEQADPDRDVSVIPKRGPGNVSTVIANHCGIPDIFAVISCPLNTGFCAKAEFRNVPVLSWAINGLQSQYLDRVEKGKSDSQIEGIMQR